MFESRIYKKRRDVLRKNFNSGLLIFPGNEESTMNYGSNFYNFRQDSSFLYYFGLDQPDLVGVIDIDENEEIIFGNDFSVDDVVWMGPQESIKKRGAQAGIKKTASLDKLAEKINSVVDANRPVHYLPQYRWRVMAMLSELLGIHINFVNKYSSTLLIEAVITQRSIKAPEEVIEIEKSLDVAYEMHTYAMRMTRPGMIEREISGAEEGIASSMGSGVSFPIIFSIHGETLHNHHHNNLMKAGDIVVNDCGAESITHYASDITRTFPVNGKFTQKQKEIYEIVLKSQISSISKIKPGVKFRDVHLHSAKIIASGLKDLGLMKGDPARAVAAGAHALFFPHGLGHMMGLDVHDMEGLGENYVGYNKKVIRSNQFGLAYLRLAKELEPGFVVTVEPGIYFIPALIDTWKSEKKFTQFINYDAVEKYKNFGGIRIEDNVLVENKGHRVLGKPIPKTITDVEQMCSQFV